MSRTAQIDRGTIVANGTVLYREVRGVDRPQVFVGEFRSLLHEIQKG